MAGSLAEGASQGVGHAGVRPGFGIEVDFVALDRLQMGAPPHARPPAQRLRERRRSRSVASVKAVSWGRPAPRCERSYLALTPRPSRGTIRLLEGVGLRRARRGLARRPDLGATGRAWERGGRGVARSCLARDSPASSVLDGRETRARASHASPGIDESCAQAVGDVARSSADKAGNRVRGTSARLPAVLPSSPCPSRDDRAAGQGRDTVVEVRPTQAAGSFSERAVG